MNITRWDPFRALIDLPRTGFPFVSSDLDEAARSWSPAVDVFEKDDTVVIRAELPGVASDDVDVSVEQGVLTLSGERKIDRELEEANAYRRERFHGSFRRSFRLPEDVDTERIEASFKDGVLDVRVPKAERARPRKIEVGAA